MIPEVKILSHVLHVYLVFLSVPELVSVPEMISRVAVDSVESAVVVVVEISALDTSLSDLLPLKVDGFNFGISIIEHTILIKLIIKTEKA